MVMSSLLAIGAAIATSVGAAQTSSSELAAELVRLMNERKLTAISAADPSDPNRFIAAMLAGQQLLAIRTRYPVPAVLKERIVKAEHQQVYGDLHGAGDKDGRVFIIDSGADGLKLARESSDVSWRNGATSAIFNMDWKTQKLKEDDYRRTFANDEKAYAEMLNTLIGSLKSASMASAQ
jgi:hypothetical protein